MDKEYNIKTNTERVDNEYWIDTEGHIHKFNGDLSEEYVSLHYVIVYNLFPNNPNPEKYVESIGWIKVGSTIYSGPITYVAPNESQINTLYDLGLLKKLEIENNGFFEKYWDRLN